LEGTVLKPAWWSPSVAVEGPQTTCRFRVSRNRLSSDNWAHAASTFNYNHKDLIMNTPNPMQNGGIWQRLRRLFNKRPVPSTLLHFQTCVL